VKFTEDRREHFIASAHERGATAPRPRSASTATAGSSGSTSGSGTTTAPTSPTA
jgi:hypothetical protein